VPDKVTVILNQALSLK